MSTDIFSKNFRPYVKYTKGHYAYDVYKKISSVFKEISNLGV